MVSAQRQFFGDVFAIGSSVEGELEVAGLADQKAVRRQDSAVGVCDGKAEFAGAILCAERGDKQEKYGGIDQGDLDQNTAQMDSPRSAGGHEIFYSDDGRRLLDGSVTAFGRERRAGSTRDSTQLA